MRAAAMTMSSVAPQDTTAPGRRRRPGAASLARSPFGFVVSFVLLASILEGAVAAFHISPILLPAPSSIASSLISGFTSGLFMPHLIFTFQETMLGFLLASVSGILLAALITQFRLFDALIYPYIIGLQSMPRIALGPLLVVWLGYGIESKIAIAALVAFFPVLANTIAGLKSRDRDQHDLMRALGATRLQEFVLLDLRVALPYIMAGLDVAIVFAILGAVAAEFVGSSMGLGFLIIQSTAIFDIARVFAALILLGVMGTLLHLTVDLIRRRIVFWADDTSRSR